MIGIIQRNFKLYMRDKTTIFFSLLSAFIVLGLFILFLGKSIATGFSFIEDGELFAYNWMFAGVLAIQPLSTALGVLGFKIKDEENKKSLDILISPINKTKYTLGYIISAFCISYITVIIVLIFSQVLTYFYFDYALGIKAIITLLLILFINTFLDVLIIFLILSFIHSANSVGMIGAVVGSLSGFLGGLFFPIGMLPAYAQWIIKLFIPSHSAVLMRQIFTQDQLQNVPKEYLTSINEQLGMNYNFGSLKLTNSMMYGIIILTSIILFAIASKRVFKKK